MEELKILRKQKGLTMKQLGEIIGVAESTISLYENGKRQPDNTTLKSLADFFNVSTDFLLGRNEIEKFKSKSGIKIPVLGRVAAGIPIDAIEEIIDYEEVTPEMAKRGNLIGLQIKGHSMEPRICDGDVVIVQCQSYIDDGHIGIVMVNGDEATCKKIKFSNAGMTLISFNPAYEPIFYSNEEIENLPVKIFGKVIELRGKF